MFQEENTYSKKVLSFLPKKISKLSLNSTATSTRRIIVASVRASIPKATKNNNKEECCTTDNDEQVVQQQQDVPAFAIAPKKVSFSPTVMVRDVEYYTLEEKETAFYKSEDYQDFKLDIKFTMQMINARMFIDEINVTRKGTEAYTPQGDDLRRTWRTKGRCAVFDTQRRLYFNNEENNKSESNNNNDDSTTTTTTNNGSSSCEEKEDLCEAIAAAYAPIGAKSAQMAYIAGLMDERTVKMSDLTTSTTANKNTSEEEEEGTSSVRTEILLMQQSRSQRIQQRRHRRKLLHSGVVISPMASGVVISPTAA